MKRYIVIVAAVAMQMCLGGLYAWSAFVPALREEFGYSATQTQLVFGTCILVFTLSMVFTGRLHDRFGPRLLATASSLLFSSGYFLVWYGGGALIWLWLGYGVFVGMGIGCGYICAIATPVKWFPRRKGLVSGISVAGYGAGAIVLANLAHLLLTRGWSVLEIFGCVGLLYGPIVLISGTCLFLPGLQTGNKVIEFRRRVLLSDRRFWQLCMGMFFGTMPGIMINGSLMHMGLSFGFTAGVATAAISFFAIGNASGRIVCGFLHDRLGGSRSIKLVLSLVAVSTIGVLLGRDCGPGFIGAAWLVGFSYGSNFALYPAQVAELYGTEVMGTVYALVILVHGLGAQLGPGLGGLSFDMTGSYLPAVVGAFAATVIGLTGYAYLGRRKQDER
ncbi:MAG: MFS transporter [Deltaproteobacteria bacterium]|nr:MFS transporter [Deltaproteobacteria bacterium]